MHHFIFCFELSDELDAFAGGPARHMPDFDPFVDACCDKACIGNESNMGDLLCMCDTCHDLLLAEVVLSCE